MDFPIVAAVAVVAILVQFIKEGIKEQWPNFEWKKLMSYALVFVASIAVAFYYYLVRLHWPIDAGIIDVIIQLFIYSAGGKKVLKSVFTATSAPGVPLTA